MQVETTIHHVNSIKVLMIESIDADGQTFYTRKIVIADDSCHEIVLIAFADDAEALAVLM